MAMAPMVLVFLVAQRWVISGVTRGVQIPALHPEQPVLLEATAV